MTECQQDEICGSGLRRITWGLSAALAFVGLSACGPRQLEPLGPPPIPERTGALIIDVVYPRDSSLIAARDSNFIFGSVGDGRARLLINGTAVSVEPNGSFLAWLPVPGEADDTLGRYDLRATLAEQEIRLIHTVRLRRRPSLIPPDSAAIDSTSLGPRGSWWVQPGEVIPIRLRATPGADVRLLLPDGDSLRLREMMIGELGGSEANWIFGRVPRSPASYPQATGIFTGELAARSPLGLGRLEPEISAVTPDSQAIRPFCGAAVAAETDSLAPTADTLAAGVTPSAGALIELEDEETLAQMAQDTSSAQPADPLSACAVLELRSGDRSVRAILPLDLWVLSGDAPSVELFDVEAETGSDGFVVGRAAPRATTLWMWAEGVNARVTGRRNGALRIALDRQTDAWVTVEEATPLANTTLPARARVGTVRLEGRPESLHVRVSISQPRPYDVQVDGRALRVTLYGAYADTDWLQYGPEDPFLRGARWEQLSSDRYVLHLALDAPVWGYRVRYESGALHLEVRKPPLVDPKRPLRARKIMIDPGHPPGGATGPTRLYEGDANLAVAQRLERLLAADGAEVILTRTDRTPVRLYDRTRRAEELGVEVLVSIHNNALPDGVNPFENHGTSVYYFHPHSLGLARALQRGLLRSLGLSDLGIGRASLALARPTWMPAALTEGAFMMVPAQEAGLRDPAFQEAYARGVRDGLRSFFMTLTR